MRHRRVGRASLPRAEFMERRLLFATTVFGATTASGVLIQPDKTGVAGVLLEVLNGTTTPQAQGIAVDSKERVSVEITAKNVAKIEGPLAKLGFVSTGAEPKDHLIDGYLPVAALKTIGTLSKIGLMGVLPAYAAQASAGNVDSQGDAALEADRTRAATGYSGAGVTVGVLSGSYNNLGTASADVSSGALPGNVDVLQDDPSGSGTDEGRAMLQIVHDLAPGANLAFATASISEASFAQNILNMAKPVASGGGGANVMVDDVVYFGEPYFQDGAIAQSINTVVANDNVAYFSAAGNLDAQAYQSSNVSFNSFTYSSISPSPQQYYNFNPMGFSATDEQELTLANDQPIQLGLQWDQPYYTTNGVTTDLNLYLLNGPNGQIVASSTFDNIANQQPYQQLNYNNTSGSTANYYLVIEKSAGTTPGVIKYVDFAAGNYGDIGFDDFATYSPTITAHAGSANAFAVGASPSFNQRFTELTTSEGPATILFNASGGRLPVAQVRPKPDAIATDGVVTTFFNQDNAFENGLPLFFGTSAAAPHAAAIAALIKQADPSWTPSQIYADMRSTANPSIDLPYFDPDYDGAGLLDAYPAVVGAVIPASVPVNDGFETGYLGQDWTTYNAGTGRTDVVSGDSPSGGSSQLVEDSNVDAYNNPSLSEAILNVNAGGLSNLTLSFDDKLFYGANGSLQTTNNYPLNSSFTGHGDFNGVCFSVDGNTWYPIVSLTGSNSTANWQTETFNLTSIAAEYQLTLTGVVKIKFQHYDQFSFSAPDGGFGFDNIKVSVSAGPLALFGHSYYLGLDADHLHLDIWDGNGNAGSVAASVLLSQVTGLSVNGLGTGGSLTVDFGKGDPLPASGLSFMGAVAQSALLIVGDNSGDTFTVGASSLSLASNFGTVPITFTNTDAITFVAGTGSDKIIQTAQPSGATTSLTGSTATDSLNVSSGAFVIPAASGGSAPVVFPLQSLSIGSGAQVFVAMPLSHATRTLLKVNSLSIAGSTNGWLGLLDLTGNDLDFVGGGSVGLARIFNQLETGMYTNPGPLTGITSSAAASDTTQLTTLGSILNTLNGTTKLYNTFDATSVGATDVLVKYTWYGDANLDGKVDGSDYSLIDNAYTHPNLTGWYNGDLNYDGSVGGSDYSLMDNGYNTQGGQL